MKRSLLKLTGAAFLIAGLALIAHGVDVRRAGSAFVTGNTPYVMQVGVESNVLAHGNTTNIYIRPGAGMALMISATTSNAAANYAHFKFGLSVDGTNFNTAGAGGAIVPGQIEFIVANAIAPGTNYLTNIQPSVLEGYRAIKLISVSNGAAKHLFVSNIIWSINRNEY